MERKSSTPSARISLSIFTRFKNVLNEQNWCAADSDRRDDIFNRFRQILEKLTEQEQELLLLLTEDFLFCSEDLYSKTLRIALEKLDKATIQAGHEVIILPLIAPDDVGRSKSAYHMMYLCRTQVVPYNKVISTKRQKVYHYQNVAELNKDEKHTHRNQALILFLDDFIGTGKTACKALNHFKQDYEHNDDKVIVVALVAQESGIQAVHRTGYEVVAAHNIKRGISDSTKFPYGAIYDADTALEIMGKIEDRLGFPVGSEKRFGYGGSEALVALMNTPDNTFPVYWSTKKVEGRNWPAPFPRIHD